MKLAKKKCNLFCEVFVYLGHEFSTTENIIRVPDTKRMFFINHISPRSKAECLSRLGSLKYYDNFLPISNVLALPITKMAHSTDDFYWDDFLEQSWQAIKMVASLQMSNSTIDQDKTLFLACDASQIAGAYILFQLEDDGNIKPRRARGGQNGPPRPLNANNLIP